MVQTKFFFKRKIYIHLYLLHIIAFSMKSFSMHLPTPVKRTNETFESMSNWHKCSRWVPDSCRLVEELIYTNKIEIKFNNQQLNVKINEKKVIFISLFQVKFSETFLCEVFDVIRIQIQWIQLNYFMFECLNRFIYSKRILLSKPFYCQYNSIVFSIFYFSSHLLYVSLILENTMLFHCWQILYQQRVKIYTVIELHNNFFFPQNKNSKENCELHFTVR